jgi:ribonuclease HI
MGRKIDIYADGAWLHRGKNNPVESGGIGAVIVEGGAKRTISVSATGYPGYHKTQMPEYEAMAVALGSVREKEWQEEPKPEIILHTDQLSWVHMMNDRASEVGSGKIAIKGIPDQLAETLLTLSDEMKVRFEFARSIKSSRGQDDSNAYAREADRLASNAAWQARLDRQGYIHLQGQGKLEGDMARQYMALRQERNGPSK